MSINYNKLNSLEQFQLIRIRDNHQKKFLKLTGMIFMKLYILSMEMANIKSILKSID